MEFLTKTLFGSNHAEAPPSSQISIFFHYAQPFIVVGLASLYTMWQCLFRRGDDSAEATQKDAMPHKKENHQTRRRRLYREASAFLLTLARNAPFNGLPDGLSEIIHESRKRVDGTLVLRYRMMPCEMNDWKGWGFTVEGGTITQIKFPPTP